MEGVAGQKRPRDDASPDDVVDAISSKKVCEGYGSSGVSPGTLSEKEEDDVSPEGSDPEGGLSSTVGELSSSHETVLDDGGESAGKELSDDATVKETLKSLEEELGVSDDSDDYAVPSSVVEDLSNSALSSWESDIWNVNGFDAQDDDEVVITGGGGDVGYSNESSPTASESLSSRNSSGLAEEVCDTTTGYVSGLDVLETRGGAGAGAVDIGFLREASDDELGIPPSPPSEREQSCEQDASGDHGSFVVDTVDTVDSLQEAVSWALEGDDNVGLADSAGIEEWMVGNLDFMMENQAVTFAPGSPLLEAGIIL